MKQQERLVIWPGMQSFVLITITSFVAVYLALGTSGLSVTGISEIALLVTTYTAGLLGVMTLVRSKIEKIPQLSLLIWLFSLVVIGASRGWLIFSLVEAEQPSQEVSLFTRVINSTITLLVWGFVFALVESRLRIFGEDYRREFADRAAQIAASDEVSSGEIARRIDNMESIQALQANLRQITVSTDLASVNKSQLIAAAERVRNEIESSLRPLSHRMWFDSKNAQPKFHVWELMKESLRQLQIGWYPTGPVLIAAFFLGALSLYELEKVLIQITFFGLALLLLLLALEKYRGKIIGSALRGFLVLVAISVSSNLFGEIGVAAVMGDRLFERDILLAVTGPVATLGILWLEACIAQMRSDWQVVRIAVSRVREDSNELIHSRFAGYLHNSLQSQLNGIALALESANPTDREEVNRIMQRLRSLSELSIGDDFTSKKIPPTQRIQEIVDAWQGIAQVDFEIQESAKSNKKLEVVVELVQEAISNAVRHSGAKTISIKVALVDQELQIEVVHEGKRRFAQKPRLGQQWLDRFSKNHEVIYSRDGKRTLRVLL